MKRFNFKGNIESIIDLFKFKKEDQTDIENSIYEVYKLQLYGKNEDLLIIEIIVYHHMEEADKVKFKLMKGMSGIILDIQSHIDLTMLIKIIS